MVIVRLGLDGSVGDNAWNALLVKVGEAVKEHQRERSRSLMKIVINFIRVCVLLCIALVPASLLGAESKVRVARWAPHGFASIAKAVVENLFALRFTALFARWALANPERE